MTFKEGKLIDKFFVNKNGKKIEVILRYPKMNDDKSMMKMMNDLTDEKCFIIIDSHVTKTIEKNFLKNTINEMKNNKKIYIAADVNGQVIGATEIGKKYGTESHLGKFGIVISKEYRSMGLGEKMTRLVIEMGKKLGIELAYMSVGCDNTPAVKLYEKIGFVSIGRMPKGMKIKGKYVDVYHMYKVLK